MRWSVIAGPLVASRAPRWAGLARVALAGVLGTSSAACSYTGESRNPAFPQGAIAAAPSIVSGAVVCGPARGAATSESVDTFNVMLREKAAMTPVTLTAEAAASICSSYADDDEAMWSTPKWRASEVLTTLLQRTLAPYTARSILVPVVLGEEACFDERATITNGSGETVGTVKTNRERCSSTSKVTLRLYLLDREGMLLWKGWGKTTYASTSRIEKIVEKLLGNVPARFARGS